MKLILLLLSLVQFSLWSDESSSYQESKNLNESLSLHLPYSSSKNTVGRIVISDRQNGIDQSTWVYVKAALDYYKESKPLFIILELNTPGGEVYPAQEISDALKEMDVQYQIPVVCYINNWAISAGAMLAYSCRYIAVVKDASMGAAEPVISGEKGELVTASEKINSAIRSDFSNRAIFFDRNPYIAEAMVDKDMIVVQRDGKIIKLDQESQIIRDGNNPDKIISEKGKLLTLNAQQMIDYDVANFYLPPTKLESITQGEKESGKWSLSRERLSLIPFFKNIPDATVDYYQMDWKTRFFVFLANPIVASLLFMGFIIGFYLELNSPGASLPGSVAVVSLFLIVLSSFSQEIGGVLELILLFAGIAALLVEIFIFPTFGLLGIAGVVSFFAGLFGLLLPGLNKLDFDFNTATFNAAGLVFMKQLAFLSVAIILSMAVIYILAKYFLPKSHAFRKFVLEGNEQDASKGYIAGDSLENYPLIGLQGKVLATLRPAGKIIVEDKIYDAISEGDYIEKGESVLVVNIDGSSLVVAKLKIR